jgi:hypothetical protein
VTDVSVRLVHLPDAKPVIGATIVLAKVHMGAGMGDMPGKAALAAGASADQYKIRTETSMAGQWALTLSAKVRGEAQPVTGTVSFNAAQ